MKVKRSLRNVATGVGVMAAVARIKCSANLEVCRPPEVQWKPPLRQAAGTLPASVGHVSGKGTKEIIIQLNNQIEMTNINVTKNQHD
jgi:hypothetical protein